MRMGVLGTGMVGRTLAETYMPPWVSVLGGPSTSQFNVKVVR